MDDIILVSDSISDLKSVKSSIASVLEITDLSSKDGTITFLGVEITVTKNKLTISQKELIEKVLTKFNMDQCKESLIPMQPKLDLMKSDVKSCNAPYKQLIGSLMYIMLGSRPDLCFCVTYFSKFQNCYNNSHWQHLKNVLKYLKATKDVVLTFVSSNEPKFTVSAFADADYANDTNDRKSVSGFIVKLNNNVINWQSKKQSIVTLSSTEAEYVALTLCLTECLFIVNVLEEVFNLNVLPICIYEDNQSAIKIAKTLETKSQNILMCVITL